MPFGDSIGMDWAWAIPALSASAFFLTLGLGRFLPREGRFIPVASITVGFVLFWYVLVDLLDTGPVSYGFNWVVIGDTTITWGVMVDRLSVTMVGLVTLVALLAQVYSLGYMKDEPRQVWYFALHGLFAGAMLALVLADSLLFLYMAWELVGLCSYLLIGFRYERRSAAEAAKKAFVTTRIGDVCLLAGIILLYRATGTFEISAILHAVPNGLESGVISHTTVNMATSLILLGAMAKSAQFPFHVWLPDAMEGHTPVNALVHAATMVAAGVYLVARVLPLFELAPAVMLTVAVVGLFTFAFSGTLALAMSDLKRVLAYSVISHLGLMMLALGAFGLAAAVLHLVVHGISAALLFLCAGSVIRQTQQADIWDMGGLRRRMPVTATAFVIGAAVLAGIPPLGGFFTRDGVLLAVLEGRNLVFVALALAASVLSSLYMARVTLVVFFGPLKSQNEDAHEPPLVMTVPLVVLGLSALTIGLLALSWTASYRGFGDFIAGDGAFRMEPWLTGASMAASLGGAAIGWLTYSGGKISHESLANRYPALYSLLVNRYFIDEIYQRVVDRVVIAFSGFVALFDRVVINDTGVDGVSSTVMLSARRLRRIQSGRMYNYSLVMALGVLGLTLIWWFVLS